jgi:cullin-associated NEDD8-dissociated protein 1
MPELKQMYDDGDAIFFANIGALVEPLTAEMVKKKQGRIPPSLFAHNIMRRSTNTLDPTNLSAFGVLGRARTALHTQSTPMQTLMASFEGKTRLMRAEGSNYEVMNRKGVTLLSTTEEARAALDGFVEHYAHNMFADEFVSAVGSAIESTERIDAMLKSVELKTEISKSSETSEHVDLASRLNAFANSNTTDRTAFFSQSGGWDTHNTFDLDKILGAVDSALGEFKREMIAQGLWDSTVIIVTSEFARTLQSNGQGSDHAWGGHTFIAGGAVKGGRILGQYPTTLAEDGVQMLSRGRVVPTTPFESVWKGILEWYGVQEPALSEDVLPNVKNFPENLIYGASDLFEE